MLRRFLRLVMHIAAACLLLGGVLFAIECFLLSKENHNDQTVDPTANSDVFDRSSVVHHALRPGAVISERTEDEQPNRFVINSFGLRGHEPAVPKPSQLYRILILGDETIFAPHVRDQLTVHSQLQQRLQSTTTRQIEVVNGGVPGYCPLLSLLQFRHRLAGLRPDLVVLSFAMNDPDDDYLTRPGLMTDRDGRALSCSHHTLAPECDHGPLSELQQFAIGRWASRRLLEGTVGHETGHRENWLTLPSDSEREQRLNTTVRSVAELATLVRQLSARFMLFSTPISEQLLPDGTAKARTLTVRDTLIQLAASQEFEFCDVSGVLAEQTDLTHDRPGLTASGHYNLAHELAAHITRARRTRSLEKYPIQQVSGVRNRF